MNTTNRRWRMRLLAGLALVLAVAVVVVVVETRAPPRRARRRAAGSTASGATTVQRRNLIETDTESGTLSYNSPQTVYNRLSGTITWLPQVGQEIKAGRTLYKVDGDPVLLMNGTTPAYRDLGPSDSDGADIEQLNRNLVALGFNAANITVDDVWQAATTEGVDLLQESLGETETGTLTLGQIVFLPGDQTRHDRRRHARFDRGSSARTRAPRLTRPRPSSSSYEVPHTPSARVRAQDSEDGEVPGHHQRHDTDDDPGHDHPVHDRAKDTGKKPRAASRRRASASRSRSPRCSRC